VVRRARGERRARLPRAAASFPHLPMIAGVLLLALGLKKVLEYVGDASHHALSDPLAALPLGAMYGGAALYLLSLVAFKYRVVRSASVQRVVVAAFLVVLAPAAAQIPALAALGMLAAVLVGLIAFEAVRFAEMRELVRHEEEVAVSRLKGDT
jgi:low temperature requirement protein LtrA